jgi:outer membrane biosynthesis protein TonB
MYLTAAEIEAIHQAAPGIEGDAEELVRQAFEAILHGQADEVAYSVTKAAGAQWLTLEIWYRRERQMDATSARAILAQGLKDKTHESPIPEDDAKAIADATELIEMAQVAWDQMLRGPEVEVILKMAAEAENGKAPEEEPKAEEPQPKEEPPEEPKAEEPAPEPDDTRDSGSAEDDSPPEPQQAEDGGGEEDLSQVEPWENYDKEKVSDIKAGINAAVREYSDDDLLSLMANVWAYEAAHKNRETVLKHLETVAERLRDGGEMPEDPPDASNDAPMDDESQEETPKAEEPEVKPEPEPQEEEKQPEEEEPEPEPEKEEPKDEEPPKEKPKRREQKKEEGGSGDDEYDRLIKQVEEELERDRLHKPEHPEEDIPNLPWDWTKMSDKDLQRFHGIYSSAAYYKAYVLAREERLYLHCKAAADELHNAIMISLEKYDEHGKEKKVALVEAEVESDENIIKWRRRQRKHETFAASHRNELNSMNKLIEALSRTETMRQNEWERSGGKMGRKG